MADRDAGGTRELVLSRTLEAPRERVFGAWLDAAHIGQWWGPNGFSTDVDEMDPRAGGVCRFTMHGPDGSDTVDRFVYTQVQRPARLCYRHDGGAAPGVEVEATFAPAGEATLLTLRMTCASAQQLEELKRAGAEEGGNQTLERLARYLAGYGSEM